MDVFWLIQKHNGTLQFMSSWTMTLIISSCSDAPDLRNSAFKLENIRQIGEISAHRSDSHDADSDRSESDSEDLLVLTYDGPVRPQDKEILYALDGQYAATSNIRELRDKGQLTDALTMYLNWGVSRKLVDRDTFAPRPDAATRAQVIAKADKVLEKKYKLAGCAEFTMPTDVAAWKWTENPCDYDQWPIALNRHEAWKSLGEAYSLTKNEAYAQEFVAQLRSWIAKGRIVIKRNNGYVYTETPDYQAGSGMLSLDSGLRMGGSWLHAYHYFLNSPSFTAADRLDLIFQLIKHAKFLSIDAIYPVPATNHNLMMDTGLLSVAMMFPEFTESKSWLNLGMTRMKNHLSDLFYEDGTGKEITTLYQNVNLNLLESILILTTAIKYELPPDVLKAVTSNEPSDSTNSVKELLERGTDFYAKLAMPLFNTRGLGMGRLVPDINDGAQSRIESIMKRGYRLFPHRKDFKWLAYPEQDSDRKNPGYGSVQLPWAGLSIMRSGWLENDSYLLFRGGPAGTSHQHEDKLNIIVNVGGKPILTEAGRYAYDFSTWQEAAISATGHNTVRVASNSSAGFLGQNRRPHRALWKSGEPVQSGWSSNAKLDFSSAAYMDGFGPSNALKVGHHRQVIFVKPGYYVVIDTMHAFTGKRQYYEALFHLDTRPDDTTATSIRTPVVVTGHTVTAVASRDAEDPSRGQVGLRISPIGTNQRENLELEIKASADDPRSFIATPNMGQRKPVQTAVYRWNSDHTSIRAWLITTSLDGQTWQPLSAEISKASEDELGIRIFKAGGARDLIWTRTTCSSSNCWSRTTVSTQANPSAGSETLISTESRPWK